LLFAQRWRRVEVDAPEEYRDREQTFFKHQVLKHYLHAWSQKLASVSQHGRKVRLWYVDCFAGPWESKSGNRDDTSVAIGLGALEAALETWADAAGKVEAQAIFVEANHASAAELRAFVAARSVRGVSSHVLEGTFGGQVSEIRRLIAADPAFIFVDPTGWKGAGMANIAPLVDGRFRDVMVNVMFHHLNRWKDDPRDFLRQQMRDFFGLADADLPPGLDEDELMRTYREQLRSRARLPHVGDLAVPHPTVARTFFRLVMGGRHPEVLRLFRDIEEKVVGRDAGHVRENARARATEQRTGQLPLGLVPAMDDRYQRMRDAGLVNALAALHSHLLAGPARFGDLWPSLLADHHITRKHLADKIHQQFKAGTLNVSGIRGKERTIKDDHIIGLWPRSSGRDD
jgi:three-Cys-motif partner protein